LSAGELCGDLAKFAGELGQVRSARQTAGTAKVLEASLRIDAQLGECCQLIAREFVIAQRGFGSIDEGEGSLQGGDSVRGDVIGLDL
jgi:hypothetical protein